MAPTAASKARNDEISEHQANKVHFSNVRKGGQSPKGAITVHNESKFSSVSTKK